jgi:hypothetical protein
VDHDHFQIPSVVPVLGVVVSIALMTQVRSEDWGRAGILLGVGVVLFAINWAVVRKFGSGHTGAAEVSQRS